MKHYGNLRHILAILIIVFMAVYIGMVSGIASYTAFASAAPPPSINEIRIDQPGTDDDEYFELAGSAGASLDGLTYLVIGDVDNGVIEAVIDLSGQSIPASGFFVAAEDTFTLGTADLITSLNFENSDNVTHLLVDGFSGSLGQDLDTDEDGTLDVEPWSEIIDSVALIETVGSGDLVYSPTIVGPDGIYVPCHVYLCPSGWQIGVYDPIGVSDTPGAPNPCDEPPLPPPPSVPSMTGWGIMAAAILLIVMIPLALRRRVFVR